MSERKVRKIRNLHYTYGVYDIATGELIYSFFFFREKNNTVSYILDNEGKSIPTFYSYFADMKRDAISGWLEMGRISPIMVDTRTVEEMSDV